MKNCKVKSHMRDGKKVKGHSRMMKNGMVSGTMSKKKAAWKKKWMEKNEDDEEHYESYA